MAEPAGRDPPLLDWRDAKHWSWTQKQCRYCPGLTNLRDSKGKAAHKICAEEALARQAEEATDEYLSDRGLR
jgi:hypothetical protein